MNKVFGNLPKVELPRVFFSTGAEFKAALLLIHHLGFNYRESGELDIEVPLLNVHESFRCKMSPELCGHGGQLAFE